MFSTTHLSFKGLLCALALLIASASALPLSAVCPAPPASLHVLYSSSADSFAPEETLSVYCNFPTYVPSVAQITCLPTGSWDAVATCAADSNPCAPKFEYSSSATSPGTRYANGPSTRERVFTFARTPETEPIAVFRTRCIAACKENLSCVATYMTFAAKTSTCFGLSAVRGTVASSANTESWLVRKCTCELCLR
jgi:hypothetical protein